MLRKTVLLFALLLIGVVIVGGSFVVWFDVSAIPEPGRFETYLATEGKRLLVSREVHSVSPQEPPATSESLSSAGLTFQGVCATCHGSDGHTPSAIGKALSPRTPDLGSAEVQHWTDPELFWIIRNGIRLSGMPGFGKHLSNEQVWNLVHYLRSLQTPAQNTKSGQ
jgi:mono/diheme cytochrome c family protein